MLLSQWVSHQRSPTIQWCLDFAQGNQVSRLQCLSGQLVDMQSGYWGPLHTVLLMGNTCVAIEEIFPWVLVAVIISSEVLLEGVLVLKDID